MKIVITGCYGFIGFNFLNHIIKNYGSEFQIIGIDKLNNPYSRLNYETFNEHENFEFFEEDICNIDSLDSNKLDKVDVLVNFAAESHVDTSIYNPELFIKSNILGVNNLLTYSVKNKIQNFVQISTDEVYGSSVKEFFDESNKLQPSSPYSASKASADMICEAFRTTFGLNIRTIRPANNYGNYQQPEKLIPFSISNLVEKKEIEIYGDGTNVRHWLSVKDTVNAITYVIEKGKDNEIYNIGSGEYKSNNEIAKMLVSYFNLENDSIKYVKDRPGHDFRYAIDFEKIKNIGWEPKYLLENTLNETIEWYLQNKEWWKKDLENLRTRRNLRFL